MRGDFFVRNAGAAFGAATLLALTPACVRHEPPSWDGAAQASASDAASSTSPPDAGSARAMRATPADGGAADATFGTATTAATATSAPDAAVAVDPATLPQTRDKPDASGPAFDARVAALWDAIVKDDPERALSFFFPLAAYAQVKAIQDPAADWKRRLVAAYGRDIHELHRKLGSDASAATFVRFEAGPAPRWVEPNEEYNKIGYWRVFGSTLRWSRADGRSEAIDVKSLISWRGEWFLVHLSAIK